MLPFLQLVLPFLQGVLPFLQGVLPLLQAVHSLLQRLLRSCNGYTVSCKPYFLRSSACCGPTRAAIKETCPATTQQPLNTSQNHPAKAPSAAPTLYFSRFPSHPRPFLPNLPHAPPATPPHATPQVAP